MLGIEAGRLLQYLLLGFIVISLALLLYFHLRTPHHLRPARARRVENAPEVEEVIQAYFPRLPEQPVAPPPQSGFDFDEDPAEYMDDANIEDTAQPPDADKVEFTATAPTRVRSDETFRIFIHIERVPNVSEGADVEETFTAIVMQVQRGERLSLVLESTGMPTADRRLRLAVDAPFQSLTWKGGNLTLDFRVRAPVVLEETVVRSRLWLTAGNEVMGIPMLKAKLDIKITVHPGAGTLKKSYQLWKRESGARAVSHKELEAHFELARLGGVGSGAAQFSTAFICHAHADKALVETYMAALEAASIRCLHDELDFVAHPHWLKQAARFIAAVDVLYIFWSRNAATRPSIHSELKIIMAVVAQRERDNELLPPGVAKRLPPVVFVVVLDDIEKMVPDWFNEDLRYTRRVEKFSTHQRAKERPRLSELAELGDGRSSV